MARALRLQIPGLPHHVIQRGVDRMNIFRSEADYTFFLTTLREAAARHQIDVHTYVLMTNHVHFLATPRTKTALSDTMKRLGQMYVQYFNRVYDRTGGLYDDRYHSLVIDSETYLFTCMRYVELNPVRAGIAAAPEDYRWSSYRAHAFGAPDPLIAPHPMYMALGSSDGARQECWRAICGHRLPAEQLENVRNLVRRGRALSGTGV